MAAREGIAVVEEDLRAIVADERARMERGKRGGMESVAGGARPRSPR